MISTLLFTITPAFDVHIYNDFHIDKRRAELASDKTLRKEEYNKLKFVNVTLYGFSYRKVKYDIMKFQQVPSVLQR